MQDETWKIFGALLIIKNMPTNKYLTHPIFIRISLQVINGQISLTKLTYRPRSLILNLATIWLGSLPVLAYYCVQLMAHGVPCKILWIITMCHGLGKGITGINQNAPCFARGWMVIGVWGRSPHNQTGFFHRRSPDLWSGFFTLSFGKNIWISGIKMHIGSTP